MLFVFGFQNTNGERGAGGLIALYEHHEKQKQFQVAHLKMQKYLPDQHTQANTPSGVHTLSHTSTQIVYLFGVILISLWWK